MPPSPCLTQGEWMNVLRHVGDMSKGVRGLTPPRFATWLVDRVRELTGSPRVAVLFCDINGPYMGMAGVECWPVFAQHYIGPWPIVAHPPCEAWGRFRWKAGQHYRHLGPVAIDLAHRFGGVVEHPWRTLLFRQHGREGAEIQTVDQCDWGHCCRKRTDLYWVGR